MSHENETKTTEPGMRIPKSLFRQMREAIRAGSRDSRRDDRVLHDETRDLLQDANDAISDWQDQRGGL